VVLLRQGKHARAEPVCRELVAARHKALPAGHWLTAEAEGLLGVSLIGQGHLAEALLLGSHERMVTAKDPPAPAEKVKWTETMLARRYEKWDRPEQAAAWRARALNTPIR
jgi:hypothetical protein